MAVFSQLIGWERLSPVRFWTSYIFVPNLDTLAAYRDRGVITPVLDGHAHSRPMTFRIFTGPRYP